MRRAAIVLPFAFVPLVSRCAVAPVGDRIAKVVIAVTPPPPAPPAPSVVVVPKPMLDAGADDSDELAGRIPVVPPEHHDVRRRAEIGPRDAGVDAAPPPKAFVVPATAVARALERRDVGAANAVAPDGTRIGARLVGVSKYGTGLQDGDIVVSVNGTRTATVDAMVSAAMGAVTGGATRIGGRVLRGDTSFGVILEIPPR